MRPINLFSSREEVAKPFGLKLDTIHEGVRVKALCSVSSCWQSGDVFTISQIQPRKIIFSNKRAQYSMLPGDFSKAFVLESERVI